MTSSRGKRSPGRQRSSSRSHASHLLGLKGYARPTWDGVPSPRNQFEEIVGGAFFVGKINKFLSRDEIYSGLLRLADEHGFYIRKLDMPFGDPITKRGNKGFCFVHCQNTTQAQRMIDLRECFLGNQEVEIKAYNRRRDNNHSFAEPKQYNDFNNLNYNPMKASSTPLKNNIYNVTARDEGVGSSTYMANDTEAASSEPSFYQASYRGSMSSDCESTVLMPDVMVKPLYGSGSTFPTSQASVQDSQYQSGKRDTTLISPGDAPASLNTMHGDYSDQWENIFSIPNAHKYMMRQVEQAQSIGMSECEFYERYNQVYSGFEEYLREMLYTDPDGIYQIAVAYSKLITQSELIVN